MFWFNRLKIVEHINFCNCCIESRANNIQFLYFFGNATKNDVVGDADGGGGGGRGMLFLSFLHDKVSRTIMSRGKIFFITQV